MTLPQQTSQQQSQHFLLKWNNHRSNMVNVFESLLTAENLVDVTIAVEGKFLKAHKIVLSACSPYFQTMFVNHSPSDRYPILLFHDIKYAHLKTLLDFMYRGEISIDEKDLGDVLKVAEALSIRGLSSFESDDEEGETSKPEGQQGQSGQCEGSRSDRESSVASSQEFDGHNHHNSNQVAAASTSTSTTNGNTGGNVNIGGNESGSVNNNNTTHHHHGKSSSTQKPKGTKTKKVINSHPTKRQLQQQQRDASTGSSSGRHSLHTNTTTTSIGSAKDKKGSTSSNINHKKAAAELSSHTSIINTTMEAAAAEVLPIKKKRGRAKKIVDLPVSPIIPQSRSSPQHQYTNKSPSKGVQATSTATIGGGGTGSKSSTLPPRHGVRRRIPRRYPGIPTRLKRVKLSKHARSEGGGGGDDGNNGSGPGSEQNPYDEIDDALLQQMLEGEDCEPLSEMSVRGLDLFKYASVEDNVYRCIECEKLRIPKTFKNKYSFQRHAFLYHEGNMRKVFPCPVCSREFSRPDKMKNHMRSVHEGVTVGGKDNGGSTENGNGAISTKMEVDSGNVLGNENDESSCDS